MCHYFQSFLYSIGRAVRAIFRTLHRHWLILLPPLTTIGYKYPKIWLNLQCFTMFWVTAIRRLVATGFQGPDGHLSRFESTDLHGHFVPLEVRIDVMTGYVLHVRFMSISACFWFLPRVDLYHLVTWYRTLPNCRRMITPLARSGKLVKPRRGSKLLPSLSNWTKFESILAQALAHSAHTYPRILMHSHSASLSDFMLFLLSIHHPCTRYLIIPDATWRSKCCFQFKIYTKIIDVPCCLL